MDLMTILKKELEGKKILARFKNDPDGKPNKRIMTIDVITHVGGGVMIAEVRIHPLDTNKTLPFSSFNIDLDSFSYQIIQTDDDPRL